METARYVVALIEALEAAQVPYMIVGSLSVSVYGVSRSTKDADFVLELGTRSLAEVTSRLGPEFVLDRQLSFETNTGTTRQVMSVGDIGFQIELFRLSADEHDQTRFARRRRIFAPLMQREVYLPTAEDVIITKLRWILTANRRKDREDVANVISVQGDSLDRDYLRHWTERHGTSTILTELEEEASKL